jgi:hypothetical protein
MDHGSYLLIICILSVSFILCKEEIEQPIKSIVSDSAEPKTDKTNDTQAPHKEEKRKVTIRNTITQKDLGYYKFFMTHYPSEFYIQVNGKRLENKEQLIVEEPQITVTYTYEWSSPLGKVKKSKTLTYAIDHKTEKIDLGFTSWKDDEPRIKAPGCSLVSITEVEESNTIPKEKMNQILAQVEQKK